MKRAAFTMVELIVVVGILGLLAAGALLGLQSQQSASRDARRQLDIKNLGSTIDQYVQLYGGAFPTPENNSGQWDLSSVGNFVQPLVTTQLMAKAPVDPINNATANIHTTGTTGYTYAYHLYPRSETAGAYKSGGAFAFYVVEARSETTTGARANTLGGVTCDSGPSSCPPAFEARVIRHIGIGE